MHLVVRLAAPPLDNALTRIAERGNEVRYFRIARRAPSPLNGERAGVRGEAVRLA